MSYRDPTQPLLSGRQIVGAAAYGLLVIISIWASGASLTSHFGLHPLLGYALGGLFALTAGMLLNSLRLAIEDKSLLWASISTIVFFLAWGASLLTNTHSFFILSNLEDIQKNEVQQVANRLDLLTSGTESWYDGIAEEFRNAVNSEATQLRAQILAVNNCGIGPEAQRIITRLGGLLGTTITPQREPPAGTPCPRGYQQTADAYLNTVNDLRDIRLAELKDQRSRILKTLDLESTRQLQEELEALNDDFSAHTEYETEKILKKAYGENARQYAYVLNQLKLPELEDIVIPETPESTELSRISSLPSYIRANGGYQSSGMLFALIIALIIDLAAFIILWRFVFPSRSN